MKTELVLLIPEIVLLALACILLVADTFISENKKNITFILSELILLTIALLVFSAFPSGESYAFNNSFVLDPMAASLKIAICLLTVAIFYYSEDYLSEHGWLKGEFFILGLFAVLGMMIMVSAGSMLTVYLGLELLSLSLYAMVAMHQKSVLASEAAMKYFITGALASGMLLYGISIIYGVTGHIGLSEIYQVISDTHEQYYLLVFGLVFILAGLTFKLGGVPFHMWVPDVYQGAPTAVTLFISTAPKLAAFAMAVRLLGDGLFPLVREWQGMFIIIAILSMALGNIVAISQTNIKRMLAYSTIAHIGFLILGLLSVDAGSSIVENGFSDAMFYIITYALMTLGVFGIIILLGRKDAEADNLEDYQGLSERSPWFAFIMLIFMFSLAGVPPFIGFWAKWFVLKEVVDSGFIWLAAVAVFFSIIGAYYYLRVVKLVYFDKPVIMTAIKASQSMRMVISINGLLLLALGLAPGMLMALCINVLS